MTPPPPQVITTRPKKCPPPSAALRPEADGRPLPRELSPQGGRTEVLRPRPLSEVQGFPGQLLPREARKGQHGPSSPGLQGSGTPRGSQHASAKWTAQLGGRPGR